MYSIILLRSVKGPQLSPGLINSTKALSLPFNSQFLLYQHACKIFIILL